MKLHLPKLLCAAVMTALAMPAMGATLTLDDRVIPVEGGDSYLNVGTGNNDTTHTWKGNLVIGDAGESEGHVVIQGVRGEEG